MKNVLYIGPDYKNHRGGIGAVLAVYSIYMRPFKFIRTNSYKGLVQELLLYVWAVLTLVYTLVTDKEIEIVHIHSSQKGSFLRKSILLLLCKLWRKKTIIHIHSGNFDDFYEHAWIFRKYIRFILRYTDAVVCVSTSWREYFLSNFKIKELTIINNLVEIEDISRMKHYQDGKVKFLFLGKICEAKGIFDLMKVFDDYRSDFKGRYSLVVAGNGEVQRFQKVISQRHLNDEVKYAGWVKDEVKTSLLYECDIYVLPSYKEGLPISVLEAMAHGKAVISTNVGGIPEIVRSGYNGWLFDPGDNLALSTIISYALDNPDRIIQFGRNSLLLSKDYLPKAVILSLNNLYARLLKDDSK
jgi:glycosyltransferase involved in cell wall biosynthesis